MPKQVLQKQWSRILDALRKATCDQDVVESLPEIQAQYARILAIEDKEDREAMLSTLAPIPGDPFDREGMVKMAGIAPTENSTAQQMASGYISSFLRWGYIRKVGKKATTGVGRPSYDYIVTDFGFRVTLPGTQFKTVKKGPGQKGVEPEDHESTMQEDVEALVRAVGVLKTAQSRKEETSARAKLFELHETILNRYGMEG
jgi:hypothetical protein